MRSGLVLVAVAMIVGWGLGSAGAQQMAPKTDTMMMHGKTLEGKVNAIRFISCGDTPQTCQGIFDITPSEAGAMMHSGAAMAAPAGDHMMMAHAVTVIVIPGSAMTWQNGPLALTKLHPGDLVKVEYTEIGNMNVVTALTMIGMAMGGHM